jgi:demethylmenaquinone methyltransferase/2-methoxy-6-polyprenyl-1,4-benzoquinol methylase
MGAAARLHVHHFVPWLGGVLSGVREYRYLQQSIAAFPPASEFVRLMEQADLCTVHATPLTFGVCHLYVGSKSGQGVLR